MQPDHRVNAKYILKLYMCIDILIAIQKDP